MDKNSLTRQNAEEIDGAEIRSIIGATVTSISTQFAFTCIALKLPDGRLCDIEITPCDRETVSTKAYLYEKSSERIKLSGEVHCTFCLCPVELWKKDLKSYDGEECRLLSDFFDLIWDFDTEKKPFSDKDILKRFRKDYAAMHTDIKDLKVTIEEMIHIYRNEGYMPGNYVKPLLRCIGGEGEAKHESDC